ncbi:hypothetical protein [Aliiroseovarius subalbicans]|uniref:hypothetical protein n=1 Tax=Aliiroseovarius subalbicans TaxID=2925840 RepID=UPI001F5AEE69|nr:hypothetical protein [Aliiroseovarius subalbicans]MCI2398133.1 hypothetical protein [Aliiroseovarius subalbicans]
MTACNRRIVIGILGLGIALPRTLFANKGRDNDDNAGFKPHYTVAQYYQLTRKQVLQIRNVRRGRDIVIDGFSISMTDYILEMSASNWSSTRRLVRDMTKITERKDRKARLQREIAKAADLVANLEASILRLKEKGGSPLAILQERKRLSDTKNYLGGLETWLKYPWEGARETD